jgi:Gram-negative bacterial TonB protein C-terminal
MIAEMPDYWKYFYQAQLDHKSIEPTDPNVFRPGQGIEGPGLVKNVAPGSNDYAQRSEVAGVASYKVILGTDGKPMAVAVYRPIGFGLDENAIAAIRKSTFTPAMKDGKAVMAVFDLAVNFRIYSKRTAEAAPETESAEAGASMAPMTGRPALPGLYTANQASGLTANTANTANNQANAAQP